VLLITDLRPAKKGATIPAHANFGTKSIAENDDFGYIKPLLDEQKAAIGGG
jgi:hypothetical protein